jgi:geranylgeranyl reductase family protein
MIAIIGAGPVGSYLASLLSKKKDVSLFEEHSEIGKPVQCTGILSGTNELKLKIPKEMIVNKIKEVELISPDNNSIIFKLKNPDLIINREKFDKFICRKAVDNGAKLNLNHRFLDYKNKKIYLRNKNKLKEFEVEYLIGADGPNSNVAKSVNLFCKRKFWIARQARIKIKNNPELFKVYFGNKIAPGFFSWLVPENENIARVGVATFSNSDFYFKNFLKILKNPRVIDYQAGLIPMYDPKLTLFKDNVYLVGDAAAQVKALSGGGIIKGMLAAEELNKAIILNLNYKRLLRKRINLDLFISLKLRQLLNKFSDEDYCKLINLLNENVLSSFNREFPKKSLAKIILKNPKLDLFVISRLSRFMAKR